MKLAFSVANAQRMDERRPSAASNMRLLRKRKLLNAIDVEEEGQWPHFVAAALRTLSEKVISREVGAPVDLIESWTQGHDMPGLRSRLLMKEAITRIVSAQLDERLRPGTPQALRRRHF